MIRDDTVSVEMGVHHFIRSSFDVFEANECGHEVGVYTVYFNMYFLPLNKPQ
jgi:hypothetical protein